VIYVFKNILLEQMTEQTEVSILRDNCTANNSDAISKIEFPLERGSFDRLDYSRICLDLRSASLL